VNNVNRRPQIDMKKGSFLGLLGALVLLPGVALAAIESAGDLDASVSQLLGPNSLEQPSNTRWQSGRYGEVSSNSATEVEELENIVPFGNQLFEGGFRGLRADGLNPQYRIMPGDQVTLRIWGAVEVETVLPVDARGNVFIPSIGPVKVEGLTHNEFDAHIRSAVRSVYPENVHVYTNLQGVQPAAVFVTGYVNKPGRYAGTPNDSVIYFIDQAGGIDNQLGSYRDIQVIRAGEVIATVDLYDFLLKGQLNRPQFQDGDTLLIGEQKNSVLVTGDVDRGYRYELFAEQPKGADLLKLARKQPGVSHVLLRGDRAEGPLTGYYTLDQFAELSLQDGDEVMVSVDKRYNTIVVELEGSYFGPTRYSLPRDAMLHDLLDAIEVPKSMTEVASVSIRRESVALRQEASLKESLKRLESTYLGASAATPQEAQIRVQEAEMISRFIAKASKAKPNGRLVVALDGEIANIRLQDGDVITIPEKSDSLLISGQVKVPQSVVFESGRSLSDYISGAGGLTAQADEDQILVVRQNGEVVNADSVTLQAGDEILVLPKAPSKNLQLVSAISQILYQLAVATKVVTDL
jgi:protein involved in polysaccharide export with SLBB domain